MKILTKTLQLTLIGIVLAVSPTITLGQAIIEDQKITPSDAAASDQFGGQVNIDDGIIVVGSRYDRDNGSRSGSAYLFDADTGAELFKLLPTDGAIDDMFGHTIDVDNGLVVIGAPRDDDNGYNSGSIYLFDVITGQQIAKRAANDGTTDDYFGYAVAMDGDHIVISAPGDSEIAQYTGSIYIYSISSGTILRKIQPADGVRYDNFGTSVAIDNGIVAVGVPYNDHNGSSSGAAYLYNAITGDLIDKILPEDSSPADEFGWSVAIDDGLVVVGSPLDDNDSGAVYLFDAATGDQLSKIVPDVRVVDDEFGSAVAIDNGLIAVGADRSDDSGDRFGATFIFEVESGDQINKLRASDGGINHYFGIAVAIENGIVVTGSDADDEYGFAAGAIYVHDVGGAIITPVPTASASMTLFPNHPNPFNPNTTISFQLENDGPVDLEVYSLRGQRVRTLVKGWHTADQIYSIQWDGRDNHGQLLSSGVYYARLQNSNFAAMQKMVLLK